jgi:hypothetical protein
MTGPGHFLTAEGFLDDAWEDGTNPTDRDQLIQAAQAHATLALAAAVATHATGIPLDGDTAQAWRTLIRNPR